MILISKVIQNPTRIHNVVIIIGIIIVEIEINGRSVTSVPLRNGEDI